jgi:hypothetical protein
MGADGEEAPEDEHDLLGLSRWVFESWLRTELEDPTLAFSNVHPKVLGHYRERDWTEHRRLRYREHMAILIGQLQMLLADPTPDNRWTKEAIIKRLPAIGESIKSIGGLLDPPWDEDDAET